MIIRDEARWWEGGGQKRAVLAWINYWTVPYATGLWIKEIQQHLLSLFSKNFTKSFYVGNHLRVAIKNNKNNNKNDKGLRNVTHFGL